MRNVQMDTRSIVTSLKVLAADEQYKAKPEEVSSVVDFCNNLVLYNKIAYDGNVDQKTLTDINNGVEAISEKLKSQKLQEKLYSIVNEEETEKAIIKKSARDAPSFLARIQGNEDFAVELEEGYKKSPIADIKENLLKYVRSAQKPDELQLERYLKDRSIRGGRFFWGLLSDSENFEKLRECEATGIELTDARVKIMFTNFRYQFADHRGQELLEHPDFDRIYYHPAPVRMRFLTLFGNHIRRSVDPWKGDIEPGLKALVYRGENYYFDKSGGLLREMETFVPILFNKVITAIGDVTKVGRANFLDCCIDISNTSELDNIRKSIDTFENLDLEDKKDMLSHIENAASCELRGVDYKDKVAGKTLIEMGKTVSLLGALATGVHGLYKLEVKKSMKAATTLAKTVSDLTHHPNALEAIKAVFGNYPGYEKYT